MVYFLRERVHDCFPSIAGLFDSRLRGVVQKFIEQFPNSVRQTDCMFLALERTVANARMIVQTCCGD